VIRPGRVNGVRSTIYICCFRGLEFNKWKVNHIFRGYFKLCLYSHPKFHLCADVTRCDGAREKNLSVPIFKTEIFLCFHDDLQFQFWNYTKRWLKR
jgi:hypothetical protein